MILIINTKKIIIRSILLLHFRKARNKFSDCVNYLPYVDFDGKLAIPNLLINIHL